MILKVFLSSKIMLINQIVPAIWKLDVVLSSALKMESDLLVATPQIFHARTGYGYTALSLKIITRKIPHTARIILRCPALWARSFTGRVKPIQL